MARRRRVRFTGKFYMLLALMLVAVTVAVVLLLSDSGGGTLETGTMRMELAVKGIVIRDEMSVTVDKYDKVMFQTAEGAESYEGMPIARVFKWGYSDDMMQSLITVETQIYEAQTALLSGVENANLANIELQIAQKRLAIRTRLLGGEGDLLTLENELASLLAQRKEYLRNTVQPTEALSALYAAEQTKQEQLASYVTEVTASGAGVVSFYFDGYEQALNYDKLGMLNPELISNALKNTANMAGGSAENLLYRLVNPNRWHVAFLTGKNEPLRTLAGAQYTVQFEGVPDKLFTAAALEAAVYDGGVVNLLEFTEPIGALLNARTVNATVSMEASGLLVPLDAVAMHDGAAYIMLRTGGEEHEVAVNILAKDEGNALIQTKDAANPIAAGQRYVKP